MGYDKPIDRVNMLAEALDAVLNVYREDVKGIYAAELVADSLPDHWWRDGIEMRGPLWLKTTRMAFLSTKTKAADMEPKTEEEHRYKSILETVSFLSLDFSNALAEALNAAKENEENEAD